MRQPSFNGVSPPYHERQQFTTPHRLVCVCVRERETERERDRERASERDSEQRRTLANGLVVQNSSPSTAERGGNNLNGFKHFRTEND